MAHACNPNTWEGRQEDSYKSEASLGCELELCLKIIKIYKLKKNHEKETKTHIKILVFVIWFLLLKIKVDNKFEVRTEEGRSGKAEL